MRILVLGSNGLLGSEFKELLTSFDCTFFERKDLDLTNEKELKAKIAEWAEKSGEKIIINCTGYTQVDKAEEDRENAFAINASAVETLAKLSLTNNFKLIHFSTDYVFNGQKSDGYDEEDKRDPINVYGESKASGEELALNAAPENVAIIRTAWLYGKYGNNFVDTMLKLAKDREELSVVDDQFGSPTYAKDLAKTVMNNFLEQNFKPGIFHLTNSGQATWYQLAKETFEIKNVSINLKKTTAEAFKRAAERPKYSVLNNNKLPKMRDWREALKSYLTD
jgi:dTDP-4-dehydrorhamnose reductase